MTTFADGRGVEGEVQDGRALADAAAEAAVGHLVYSSVGGAERETGVPHFESKRRVEEHIAWRT
ncbi:NmrA family NAD(P)-binding protein [Modestobacter sp. VKM Ac-2983]|uniref:NmrA family NAD(P)-binding protein n=1 Tax=Modestobacter sp. VKM Ac-2983 TaxID=3004137 RepID=UPI0022ABBEE0|nr:NmrA family NAD(P)-binding protein [Modestobacter sp. VKM Ac-2983]MCZ2804945.1 NmrA family NAD(P)-binding protein [Modestobacter sp. VKM Ac-2983]